MAKKSLWLGWVIVLTVCLSVTAFAARKDMATYYMPAEDQGVILEPSQPGEEFFQWDGYGIREGNINKVGDTYYVFYDGAANHEGPCDQADPEKHLWRTCLAKSTDLVNWTKLGVRLQCGYDVDPTSSAEVYKDFMSASSPWVYYNEEDEYWYMLYLGAEGAAGGGLDVGTPSLYYSTCVAKAATKGLEGIEGEWIQYNQLDGQAKAVALWQKPATCSPGSVIQNPKWTPGDTVNKRYMMFITRGDQVYIARSNQLDAVHNWDEEGTADGWTFDAQILDKTRRTAPENATIYYDENTGWYYLFTNQFNESYTYTDCNIVYWTKDPDVWDPANCATIIDGTTTKDGWATGAIGMPTVAKVDDETVAIVYDASPGSATNHTGRKLGIAYWTLPKLDEAGVPEGTVKTVSVNNSDPRITYNGSFTYANPSNGNDYEADLHYSTTAGDSITFEFYGTYIQWIGERAYNRGTAEVFIDGVSYGMVSAYEPHPTILYQQVLFAKGNLSLSYHTLQIVLTGDGYIDVDAFKVQDIEAPEKVVLNDDNKYFGTLVQKTDFAGNQVDGNWTFLNGSGGAIADSDFFQNEKFVKTNTDYWGAIASNTEFGKNTIVQATVKVGTTPDYSHTRFYLGVRNTSTSVVTQGANGIWFGFSNSATLIVSVNGSPQTEGNYVEFNCGVDFSTEKKIEIHDNGNYINLYAYDGGERKKLATVYIEGALVKVQNGAGEEVFSKTQAVNEKGTICVTMFGAVGEIDDIVISAKENFDFVKDGEACETLGGGEYNLKFYEPLDGSAYICAMYDGTKLSRIYIIASQETTVTVTEGEMVRLFKYKDLTNIKPVSGAVSY